MILGTLPVRHEAPFIPVHFVFKIEKSEYLDLLMLMALWDVQGEPFEDSSEATCKSSGI